MTDLDASALRLLHTLAFALRRDGEVSTIADCLVKMEGAMQGALENFDVTIQQCLDAVEAGYNSKDGRYS